MFLLHEYYINVSIKGDMNINEIIAVPLKSKRVL